jgi:predicted secreted protein
MCTLNIELIRGWLLTGLMLVSISAVAHDNESTMNRVSFQVERSAEVSNDWVTATLSVTDEDPRPERLANTINTTMRWALDEAQRHDQVKVSSGGYQTYPVYEKERVRRWRASQQLILQAGNVDRLSKLIGVLQEKLQLQSIAFSVSPESRTRMEDGLITDALAAFQARAELVQQGLGAKDYETVKLAVNSGGGSRPMRRAMAYNEMAMSHDAAPPVFEVGTSRVSVQISATIELN